MMLAAVETVTKADPVWESRRHNSDVAAKATARESVHAASPLKSSGRNVYNEPRRASIIALSMIRALARLHAEDQVFVFSIGETPHGTAVPDIGGAGFLSNKRRSV